MKLNWPIKGIGIKPGIWITQRFGESLLPYKELFGMTAHNGLDIKCPEGTPLYAVADGYLIFEKEENAGLYKGYGLNARLFIPWENGETLEAVYGHLEKFEGQNRKVKAGDLIGYADSTGYSTGSHLHFGIRKLKDGKVLDYNNGYFGYFDPLPIMKIRAWQVKDGKEISLAIPLDTMNRWAELKMSMPLDDYELEESIIPFKKPWPTL